MRTGKIINAIALLLSLFILVSCGGGGSSSKSGGDGDGGLVAPIAPTSAPTLTAGDGLLTVDWDEVEGATSYEVYYGETNDSGAATLFQETEDTTVEISGLDNGIACYVWIRAKNDAGMSDFGPAGSETPEAPAGAGWPLGIKQYGTADTEYAIGMVKDKDGNIYVTGYTDGNLDPITCVNVGGRDIFLVKYDADGVRQWTKMIGSTRYDEPYGIAYDGDSGIFITGYTAGNLDGETTNDAENEVMFLSMFTTGGSRAWTKLYNLAGSRGYGITVNEGSVYVSGIAYESSAYKMFLAKYNGVGVEQWTKYVDAASNGLAVALDASSNIYVVGNGPEPSMVLYKFNSSGNELWNVKNTSYTSGRGIALDSEANIYFTGSTSSSHSFLVKYDTDGNLGWTKNIDSGFYPDGGNAVMRDGSGNIYVLGGTRGDLDGQTNANPTNTSYDLFLIKYNSAGTRQWTKLLGTTAYDAGIGLVPWGASNVLVYGHTEGTLATPSGGGQDYFFAQYDSAGDLQ